MGTLFAGVDLGAAATKVVLVDGEGEARARIVRHSGVDYSATARECVADALTELAASQGDIRRTVSTGYGRRNVEFADRTLTEIHCHAVGCHHLVPGEITIVDIGGQDNKVVRLTKTGKRIDFKMNRKCAAGTGAFIEEMAVRLGVSLSDMEQLAHGTDQSVRLSSFCTVFAKTEILAHLRKGVPVEEIVRGAYHSVINRVVEMDPLEGQVVMTGGVVAHHPTIATILSDRLGREVVVPPWPQFTGALGAALSAMKQVEDTDRKEG